MTQPAALAVFTDGDAMRRLLQARLPGFADGSLRIDRVGVRQARRNTSLQRNPRRLTVCYELQVQDLALPRCGAQLLYGEVFRDPQAAASSLADTDRPPLVTPAFGQARVQRGGSWDRLPEKLHAGYRLGWAPDAATENTGFRVARDR